LLNLLVPHYGVEQLYPVAMRAQAPVMRLLMFGQR
jgi:hypothetical protein